MPGGKLQALFLEEFLEPLKTWRWMTNCMPGLVLNFTLMTRAESSRASTPALLMGPSRLGPISSSCVNFLVDLFNNLSDLVDIGVKGNPEVEFDDVVVPGEIDHRTQLAEGYVNAPCRGCGGVSGSGC